MSRKAKCDQSPRETAEISWTHGVVAWTLVGESFVNTVTALRGLTHQERAAVLRAVAAFYEQP